MDENTIRGIPTRNLLQIHAAYVATLGGTEDEIRHLHEQRRKIEDSIAAIDDRTKGMRDLAAMTGRRLVEVGFTKQDLDEAVAGINSAVTGTFDDGSEPQEGHGVDDRRGREQDPRHGQDRREAQDQRHARDQRQEPRERTERDPREDGRAAFPSREAERSDGHGPDPRPRREAPPFRDVHAAGFGAEVEAQRPRNLYDELEQRADPIVHEGGDPSLAGGFAVSERVLERVSRA